MNNKKIVLELLSSLISLVLTLSLLVVVVMAWYVTNTEASVGGIVGSTSTADDLTLVSTRSYMLDEDGNEIDPSNGEFKGLLFNDSVYYEVQIKTNEKNLHNIQIKANNILGGDFFTKLIDENGENTSANREVVTYGGRKFNMCDCFSTQILNVNVTKTSGYTFDDSNKAANIENIPSEYKKELYLDREDPNMEDVNMHNMLVYNNWNPQLEGSYIAFKFAIKFTASREFDGKDGLKTVASIVGTNELSKKSITISNILITR